MFPCQIPGHDLVIERLAPYSGLYVEDGSNEELSDVAMLLIRNTGSQPVEYTQIVITYPSQTLQFYLSALPGGESAVVQERSRLPLPQEKPTNASALVVERTEMAIAPEISVTDNGDNTLTVTNLTDKDIPTVRIFYKYYMEEENLFVGGIAFTVKLNRLGANKSLVVQPAHYTSQNSKIVMVLTYDTVQ